MEREYERDDDGRFASTGSGGSGAEKPAIRSWSRPTTSTSAAGKPSAKDWAAETASSGSSASAKRRPVPKVLLDELERRGWGREVAKRMGDDEEHEDEHARIGRILDRIEKRYGAVARLDAEDSIEKGAKEGGEWHAREFGPGGRLAKPLVPDLEPGGFWRRK